MNWKEEYSLGIPEIDHQHKGLLRSFSDIEDAIREERHWSDIHYSIVELRERARSHFTLEEALMRLFGYKDADSHGSAHEYFFERLDEIESRSLHNGAKSEMMNFLLDWLTKHITGSDRGYAAHIFSGAKVVKAEK